MESKKSKKYTWVKGPLDKPVSNIPPHNASPNMGQFDGRSGDNVNRTELAKTLPDDEEAKAGFGVATFGGVIRYGSCTYCRNPMYLLPIQLFCPSCRRMLAVQTAPYSVDPTCNTKMTDGGIPEDSHKTPSRNELRQNLDQYNGGGSQSNDVYGRKS